jgi:hypothetical protein
LPRTFLPRYPRSFPKMNRSPRKEPDEHSGNPV